MQIQANSNIPDIDTIISSIDIDQIKLYGEEENNNEELCSLEDFDLACSRDTENSFFPENSGKAKKTEKSQSIEILSELTSRRESSKGVYEILKGITKGKMSDEYLIGFEGSGLATDHYIEISTEWYDHDGSALPPDLEGYMGRIAAISAKVPPDAPDNTTISKFELKPGLRTQVVRIPEANNQIENLHFYIHVDPRSKQDPVGGYFSENGNDEDDYRPDFLVPVKVPILDQQATIDAEKDWKDARREDVKDLPEKPLPVYRWAYRPEFQFSVFDLTIENITLRDKDEELPDLNILDLDTPVITPTYEFLDINAIIIEGILEEAGISEQIDTFGPERELIFAVGEEEVRVTYDEWNQPVYSNLDHLALLDPIDYTMITLYQNNDFANKLYQFGMGLQPVGGPDNVLVSAGDEVEVYLYMPGGLAEKDEKGNPKKITLKWSAEGPGNWNFAERVQETTDGLLINTFYPSTKAEDKFTITATIIDSTHGLYNTGTVTKIGPIEIIPGKPSNVIIETLGESVPADGVSEASLYVFVKDSFGNNVADGTAIDLSIIGDSGDEIDMSTLETTDGATRIPVVGGIIPGPRTYIATVSDEAWVKKTIEFDSINLSASASSHKLTPGENITINVSTNAADGASVNWVSTIGTITGDSEIISGHATATLTGGATPGDGYVFISVAGEKEIIEITQEADTEFYAAFSNPAIVGDKINDGSIEIEHWDGSGSYDYPTSTDIKLHGNANSQMRLAIGTPLNPNAEPIVYFPFQNLVDGQSDATNGSDTAMVLGDVKLDENRGALVFETNGHLMVQDNTELWISDNLFASIDFEGTDLDTSDWDEIGPSLKRGPPLVQQGSDSDLAYRLGVVEYKGEVRVEAVVTTEIGTYSVVHNLQIQPNLPYSAALRYKNGLLEIEVADKDGSSTIERVSATGLLQNIDESIYIGSGFKGLLRCLRIGVESEERLLARLSNGESHQDVVLGNDGTATVGISSNGILSGLPHSIGISYAVLGDHTTYQQPIRFAQPSIGEWLLDSLSVQEAHAGWWFSSSSRKSSRSGLAIVSAKIFGLSRSLAKKVAASSDKIVNVAKAAGNIAAMIVGLDDFIVLTKAIMDLAAGARGEIKTIEVTFAAIGAIMTITEIVSVGSLSPVIQPLKYGMKGFKVAIKAVGPTGLKAAYAMAKSLGEIIIDVVKKRGARGASFDLLKNTVITLGHLASSVGKPIFQTFVSVVRAPVDFFNWVKALKTFRKAGGCVTSSFGINEKKSCYAFNFSPSQVDAAVIGTAFLAFWIGTAEAAPSPICELAFEAVHAKILTKAGAEAAPKTSKLFNEAIVRIENEIVKSKEFNLGALKLGDEAVDGMIQMMLHNKKSNNIFFIAKSVAVNAKKMDLSPSETKEIINRFFTLLGRVEKYDDVTVGWKLWADAGKLMGNPGKGYNDGFITGLYNQLEHMDELRAARQKVKHLEECVDVDGVRRFNDIVLDTGRRVEVKNLAHYALSNRKTITKGLEKDLTQMLRGVTNAEEQIKKLKDINIVLRGRADWDSKGAKDLVKEMRDVGKRLLNNPDRIDAWEFFSDQMDVVADAVKTGRKQIISKPGDLLIFQNKRGKY
jgi:hypothetical protein